MHLHLNDALPAEEFQQHCDTLPTRHEASHNALEAGKRTTCHFYLVADFQRLVDGPQLIRTNHLAKVINRLIGNSRPEATEMDHCCDSACVLNGFEEGLPIEAGEQVIREQRLSDPDGAPAGGALEPDSRVNDFQLMMAAQIGGGDVLVPGLRTHAVPGQS